MPLAERICEMCGLGVETVDHFLLRCTQHKESRARLFGNIDSIVKPFAPFFQIQTLSEPEQLSLLLSGTTPQEIHPKLPLAIHKQILSLCALALSGWSHRRTEAENEMSLLLREE